MCSSLTFWCSIAFSILFFLPDWLFSLYGCMIVQPIADGIALVVAIGFYVRIKRSLGLNRRSSSATKNVAH